jgi:hypothetical protein
MRAMHTVRNPVLVYPLNIDHIGKVIILSDNSDRIRLEGVAPEVVMDALERLNNSENPAGGATSNSESRSELVRVLKQEQLAFDCLTASCTGSQMAALLQETYSHWNQQLFSSLLWTSLFAGTAEDRVVDGWLIESYHFIRAANARLTYATAHADDERIRDIFAHQSLEEYNHHEFFAESLRRRGLDPVIVDRVGPLPTTRAVVDMARYAARADCLAYAACSGLLESTGSDADKARSFYRAVSENFDKEGKDFVAPMLEHINLDEAYEHGSVMRHVFDPIPVISAERADRIIQIAHLFKETLELWFDDILQTYFRKGVDRQALRRDYRFNSPR